MNTPPMTDSSPAFACDVLVVGGGPAGATISALLAERGRDVVMMEKAHPAAALLRFFSVLTLILDQPNSYFFTFRLLATPDNMPIRHFATSEKI